MKLPEKLLMFKGNAEFQEKIELLKVKYPLLKRLYEQDVCYESMPECPIKRQVEKELGIIGWESTPIYKKL